MQYGNLRIRMDRAWSNPGQLPLTLCLSPHLGAGSHPALLLFTFVGAQHPLLATRKVFLLPEIGSFVTWQVVSNRIPFCRVALPAQLEIAVRFYFDKILSSSHFPQRPSKAPTLTSKGFKGTPWDMPYDGWWIYSEFYAYCFYKIHHIRAVVHSFVHIFWAASMYQVLENRQIFLPWWSLSLCGKGGEGHLINK